MLLKYNDIHVLIIFGDEIDFCSFFISSCHSSDFKCSKNILLFYFIQTNSKFWPNKVFKKVITWRRENGFNFGPKGKNGVCIAICRANFAPGVKTKSSAECKLFNNCHLESSSDISILLIYFTVPALNSLVIQAVTWALDKINMVSKLMSIPMHVSQLRSKACFSKVSPPSSGFWCYSAIRNLPDMNFYHSTKHYISIKP